ncbi:MAG TPA: hypothetical protein QGG47_09385 [Acidobacteriota bacterium]|nr:hypothetical protein [Acidobacteriota bacterium]
MIRIRPGAPRLAGLALACVALSCGRGEAPPARSDEFVPARDLSLAELAAQRTAEPRFVRSATLAEPPSAYEAIIERSSTGEIDPIDADRMLLSLFFGSGEDVPAELLAEGASHEVPDGAIYRIGQRMQEYPEAVQAELQTYFERWYEPRALAAAPSPSPLMALAAPPTLRPAPALAPPSDYQELSYENITVRYSDDSYHALAEAFAQEAHGYYQDIVNTFFLWGQNPWGNVTIYADPLPLGETPGYLSSCFAIHLNVGTGGGGEACMLRSALIHELFHCAHFRATGNTTSSLASPYIQDWTLEGAASWSVEYFEPAINGEWHSYAAYPAQPYRGLRWVKYAAGPFYHYVNQTGGADKAQALIKKFSQGQSMGMVGLGVGIDLPDGWHDYVESMAGYEPLFDDGTTRLSDTPVFPYEDTPGCMTGWPTGLGQEPYANRYPVGPDEFFFHKLEVEPVAGDHFIVETDIDDSVDYILVGFSPVLDEAVSLAGNDVRIKAVIYHEAGEMVQDWTELWAFHGDDTPDLLYDDAPNATTDGSFRICVAPVGPCAGEPEILVGVSEIRVVVSNAQTSNSDTVRGEIVIFPTGLPGWEAEEFLFRKPEEGGEE